MSSSDYEYKEIFGSPIIAKLQLLCNFDAYLLLLLPVTILELPGYKDESLIEQTQWNSHWINIVLHI